MNELAAIYGLLTRLYPRDFHDEFREEMTAVFMQAMVEASERGVWALTLFFLREWRDLALNLAREHWRALHGGEVIMSAMQEKPKGLFYFWWVMLSALSVPLAFMIYWGVISMIVPWAGARMQVGDQSVITEDYLLPYIFIPAIGMLTGLFQYFLLRRYWPRFSWWILATSLGWILTAGVMVLRYPLGSRFGWNFTSVWLPVLAYAGSGGIAGLAQWLLLRQRLPHATWWIFANIIGWGLIGVTAHETFRDFAVIAIGLLPAIASGSALWLLLKKLPLPEGRNASV